MIVEVDNHSSDPTRTSATSLFPWSTVAWIRVPGPR